MIPLVYHPSYDLNLGAHVFPAQKYRLIRERLADSPVHTPEPATDAQVQLVHSPAWTTALRDGTLTPRQLHTLEIPWSPAMAHGFRLAAGGTLLAARLALAHGAAYNIGGGFHHAFPNHGEGFCALHDVAIAIRTLQSEGLIPRAMVIDTDVHHGNGTAAIFAADPSVFTLSIHQQNNYPAVKPPSDLDLPLADGVGDEEYLAVLAPAVERALATFPADIVFYVAGADPYYDDQLGGLDLSLAGLLARDEAVFAAAMRRRIPVIVTLAGGYARRVEDTVTIHTNTALSAYKTLSSYA
jgi:acetoin utilization deacetylase AcuC-like enzyme